MQSSERVIYPILQNERKLVEPGCRPSISIVSASANDQELSSIP